MSFGIFNNEEKRVLLTIKGVGPTVIKRFEEIGINSLSELKLYNVDEITEMVAKMLNSTCWRNSPQAKAAINASIELAKNY